MARKDDRDYPEAEGEVLRFLVLTKLEKVRAFQGEVVRRKIAFPADQIIFMEELDDGGTRIRLFSGDELIVEESLDFILGA
jgi:hypothetical protein